jgi:hypothetical protein
VLRVTAGPEAVLRPDAAARWPAALADGAAGAPEPDRVRALGLAAALAVGLGERGAAAQALRQLRASGAFGELVAAALAGAGMPGAHVPVAGLTPQDRDWVVLQCYRAGREVPAWLAAGVDPAALASADPLSAIESLAHAALAGRDPAAVGSGLHDWLARADADGLDQYVQREVLAPLCRTVGRLGLRGRADLVDPGAFGRVLRDGIDSQYRSELRWEFAQLADRLLGLGYDRLVAGLAAESAGWGTSFDDLELAALLRQGRDGTAAERFAVILEDRAQRPIADGDGFGVLPSGGLEAPVVEQMLEVAWRAPPSTARTGSLAQLAVLSAQAGRSAADLAQLVAQVRALIDPRASTERWAGHPYVGSRLIERETVAAGHALLDLALASGATEPALGLALIRQAWEYADPAGPLPPIERGGVDRSVARALGRLPSPPALPDALTGPERRLIEAQAAQYDLGRVEQGRPAGAAITGRAPEWVRTLTLQTLTAQGRWTEAIAVAVAGTEKFVWGQRLGLLARSCADLDAPDALAQVLGAVAALPLGDEQVRAARGVVLRHCVFADCWSW